MRWFVIISLIYCMLPRESGARPAVMQQYIYRLSADSIPCQQQSHVNSFLKRITKYPFLFPAYNDNDGFMLGAGFTNVFKTDSAAMRYLIAPAYSFSQEKVLGIASLQYIKYVNQASISSYVGGLTLRSFDIQRNVELDYALRYFLIRPFVGIVFKHSDRPEHESRLTFSASIIMEEEAVFSSSGSYSGLQSLTSDIYRIRYEKKSCIFGKMQGYSISAEQQQYGENHYLKISGGLNYAYPYRKERFVYLRFFSAVFPVNTRRKAMGYQNAFTRGTIALIHQGFNDYAYDESFFSRRNQDRTFDNQVSLDEGGGFKTPIGSAYNIGMSNDFAASVNWSADTPFKTGPVDLRIFIDAGIYRVPENGKMKAKSLYSGGFSLHYRDIGALHFPLMFNTALGNTYREAHLTFFSRISFSLNIERFLLGRPKQWYGL